MIHLFTGIPGIGKTSYVVSELSKVKDRPIFVMGIPELKIPHEAVPPIAQWTEMRPSPDDPALMQAHFTFPPNALIVIDEAQTVYRPRASAAKVPPYVAAFETHRHTGVDFWLITQSPKLIDSNIRELVSRHVHFRQTMLGRKMHEWAEMGDPDTQSSRAIATTKSYKPPKKAFDLYKSSVAHTKVIVGIPGYVYMFVFALIATVALGFVSYNRINQKTIDDAQAVGTSETVPSASGVSSPESFVVSQIESEADYIKRFTPRIEGIPETAPAYDELTEPVAFPDVQGCIQSGDFCKCLTQQGTEYHTTALLCRQFVKAMPFKYWRKNDDPFQLVHAKQEASKKPDEYKPNGYNAPGVVTPGDVDGVQWRVPHNSHDAFNPPSDKLILPPLNANS